MVSLPQPTCVFHISAVDYGSNTEKYACCGSVDAVVQWLRDNQFRWDDQVGCFYAEIHRKFLVARITNGCPFSRSLSIPELRRLARARVA